MAFNGIRGKGDRVTLDLAGKEVLILENYEVKASILTQPAAFTLHIGYGDLAQKLLAKYPPRTPFKLLINETVYQTGLLDGINVSGQATKLALEGRDMLQDLHDGFVRQEFSIDNATYADVAKKIITAAGLDASKLVFTNRANRLAITGKDTELEPPRNVELDQVETDNGGQIKRQVQARLGERLYQFGKRHFDRGGLFLWAAADGSFVLSEPNAKQAVSYQLQRRYKVTGAVADAATIIDERFSNRTRGRYAACDIYVRGGGRKFGRTTATASVDDKEMQAWGYTKRLVLRDADADTQKKAEFMARRHLAETRRQHWTLSYKVMGHTTVALGGGTAVWCPDTLVYVRDDKLGLDDVFYIEGVTFNSGPETTTTLDLLRPVDLIFSDREQ